MNSSVRILMLAAGLAVAQAPGLAQETPDTPATAAEAAPGFEQTAEPPWTYESPVTAEEEPPATPDPMLREVNAELDRLAQRQPPSGVTQPAAKSSLGMADYLQVLLGLCIVLAVILGGTYLLKRFGNRTPLLAGSSLGTVLGKIYLAPRASLHFVRTGGRVLVVGVTQNAIGLVSEFDAAAFEAERSADHAAPSPTGPPARAGQEAGTDRAGFLTQLKASARDLAGEASPPPPNPRPEARDADIDSLREDIARLQRYLKENLRED